MGLLNYCEKKIIYHNKECVDECSSEYYIYNNNYCVTQDECNNEGGFIKKKNNNIKIDSICYESCESFIFKIGKGGYCMENCEEYYQVDDSKECVENCSNYNLNESPNNYYYTYDFEEKLCLSKCPDNAPYYFITDKKCLESCGDDYIDFSSKKCVSNCD